MVDSTGSRELKESDRCAICHDLLEKWSGNHFPYATIKSLADKYGVSRTTVRRYWNMGRAANGSEHVADAVKSRKTGRVGRKRTPVEVMHKALKALPKRRRRTYRHAAKASGISVGALWNAFRRGDLKRTASKISITLHETSLLTRLKRPNCSLLEHNPLQCNPMALLRHRECQISTKRSERHEEQE